MILMLIVLYDFILPRFRFHCPALLHSPFTATAALYSPMNSVGAPGLREQACICLCLVESAGVDAAAVAAVAGGTPTSPSCNCFAFPRDTPM